MVHYLLDYNFVGNTGFGVAFSSVGTYNWMYVLFNIVQRFVYLWLYRCKVGFINYIQFLLLKDTIFYSLIDLPMVRNT